MTTDKMTEEMKREALPSALEEKTEKKTKKRRWFKSSATLYIWLTVIGVVLIGAGCGISVFELSEYKTANYRALPLDPALPQVEMQTTTLEASYEKGEQFKLDIDQWNITGYDIQYDNSLKDKVIIEVTAPKELYNVYLTTDTENHYYLHCEEDIFGVFRYTLDLAKDSFIPEYLPPVTLKLTMSEAQAKNFKLNEELYKAQEAANDYREELNIARTEYNEQLNQQRNEYTEQLHNQRMEYDEQVANMRTEYHQQINDLQEQHAQQIQTMQEEHNTRIEELQQNFNNQQEEQRNQYERRIAELEMQLEDARNALN